MSSVAVQLTNREMAMAAECGLHGGCFLGEIPHVFSQLPFPKASLAILESFTTMSGLVLDFTEIAEQAQVVERQLGELFAQMERRLGRAEATEEEEPSAEPSEEERLHAADKQRIEELFERVANDRSKAFELKQELDRLGVFKDYEDRFLDLFKKPS